MPFFLGEFHLGLKMGDFSGSRLPGPGPRIRHSTTSTSGGLRLAEAPEAGRGGAWAFGSGKKRGIFGSRGMGVSDTASSGGSHSLDDPFTNRPKEVSGF